VLACSASAQTPYDTVFEQIRNLAPLPNAAAPVHGVVLRRDVMELRLDDGVAYQLTPVAGRTMAIAWVGSGSLSFIPPLLVEQFNLKRVWRLHDQRADHRGRLLLCGFDGNRAGAVAAVRPAPRGAADPGGAIGSALDYIVDGRSRSADASLVTALLNHTTTGFFAAYVQRKRGESVMIQLDPAEVEEILLYRRGEDVGSAYRDRMSVRACRGSREWGLDRERAARAAGRVGLRHRRDDRRELQVFRAHDDQAGRPVRRPQQWVPFYLYEELQVDSVVTDAGVPLTFARKDHFRRALDPAGRTARHGKDAGDPGRLPRQPDRFGSALPPMWDEARGDLRTVPRRLGVHQGHRDVVSPLPRRPSLRCEPHVSHAQEPALLEHRAPVQADTQGNTVVTKWVSELPTNQVSFNIGSFDESRSPISASRR